MKDEIALYQPNDQLSIEVKLENETVWLTQQQMAMLFNTTRNNITLHIGNIFKEGELDKDSVCKESLLTAADGKVYKTNFYNLDVIISVGYRVKSIVGTKFRQWANRVIKDYMLKGYAVNQRLLSMEERIDKKFHTIENTLADHQEKIDFFVRTNVPPVEQVFFEGEFFAARVLLEKLIKTAKKRVIIIDRYVDAATFEMLDVRAEGVTADLYSDSEYKSLRDMHNATKGLRPVNTHKWSTPSHDLWLIIDDSLYHCGHSLKDMGKKLSAIMLMGTTPDAVLKEVK